MLTLKLTLRTVPLFAAAALALATTGCSSNQDHAAFSSLRGLAFAARPTAFASATARGAVAVQRHARAHAHALSGGHTIATLHHQTARNL